MSDLIQLAQDRQIETNVWRGRYEEAERENTRLRRALEIIAHEAQMTGDMVNVANRALNSCRADA